LEKRKAGPAGLILVLSFICGVLKNIVCVFIATATHQQSFLGVQLSNLLLSIRDRGNNFESPAGNAI